MAVKLRLKRMGKKRQPVYKVVAADSRSPRDGRFIEAIGLYNPKTEPATVIIDSERAMYWLSVGAQPTDTVKNLLSKKGILLKKELVEQGLTEEQIAFKLADWQKNKEEKSTKIEVKAEKKQAQKVEPKKEEINEGAAEAQGAASDE